MKNIIKIFLIGFFVPALSVCALADNPSDVTQMVNMNLEDLLNTKVTSASGREQKLDDVANAMYVITKEDIERSGAREVADLLYRVPGLQIRQIDGNQYGVGIRENGSFLTNNLLILIDGAVVFNPFFGGTLWQNLPVSLNEIERIEIIRGSPGVLYSSNAVEGVINIITKSADAKDNYVQQEGGTQSYRDSSVGVGEKLGATGLAFRAYLDNQFDQGLTKTTQESFSNRYLSDRDGGRIDYTPTENQRLSVIANNNQQGSNALDYITTRNVKTPGETTSAIVNYTNKVTDVYDFSFHFDHVEQVATAIVPDDVIVHTTSASMQNNFHYDLLGAHVTSVGGELRYNALHVAEDLGIPDQGLVTNGQASQKIISFFAQDEYRPIDKLILTAGVREDSNSLVINEDPLYSPKVSALYHITDNHSIWVSSSHDYRTPTFTDHDLSYMEYAANHFYPGSPAYILQGSTDLKPESVSTQEVGYRGLFLDQKLKADATFFLTNTKDVIIMEDDMLSTSNNGSLSSKGTELALDYQLTNNFSITSDYSYLYPHFKPETSNTPYTVYYDQSASNNIAGVGMRYTLNKLKLDLYAKYFEGYKDPTQSSIKIRGYYRSFMRISYDFVTPKCLGRLDSTMYLDINDAIGARQTESDDATSSNKVFIKPEVTAGIKIKF